MLGPFMPAPHKETICQTHTDIVQLCAQLLVKNENPVVGGITGVSKTVKITNLWEMWTLVVGSLQAQNSTELISFGWNSLTVESLYKDQRLEEVQ